MARQLAIRILNEGLDPLAYARDFELLWIRAEHPVEIQEVGCLEDAKAWMTDAELRMQARELLLALVAGSEPKL